MECYCVFQAAKNITLNVDWILYMVASRAVLNKMHIYKFILCPLVVLCSCIATTIRCIVSFVHPLPNHRHDHYASIIYSTLSLLIIPTANLVYCIVLLENIQNKREHKFRETHAHENNLGIRFFRWCTIFVWPRGFYNYQMCRRRAVCIIPL